MLAYMSGFDPPPPIAAYSIYSRHRLTHMYNGLGLICNCDLYYSALEYGLPIIRKSATR